MTSLTSWIAIDQRGPSAVYLASDSRISWSLQSGWDFGRKIWTSSVYPEIVGYCGDVLFPSQVLPQIIAQIDSDVFFGRDAAPESKFEAIATSVKSLHRSYPTKDAHQGPFSIVHCSRFRNDFPVSFALFELSWSPIDRWSQGPIPMKSTQFSVVKIWGSGKPGVTEWLSHWNRSDAQRTSRSVFSAFCDNLIEHKDILSGGGPQLAGIYRKNAAQSFGVIYNGERFLHGLPVNGSIASDAVEWRNQLFELCDGQTGEKRRTGKRMGSSSSAWSQNSIS